MNLPVKISFANGQSIRYKYEAAGVKLQKTVNFGTYTVVTDYMGGYQYETKPANRGGRGYAELLFFPMYVEIQKISYTLIREINQI